MTRWVRELASKDLAKTLSAAESLFLVDFRGLKGNQAVELRAALRDQKARLKVVKNAVAAKALEAAGRTALREHLSGMNAILWGEDPVSAVKAVREFAEKTNKSVTVKAGTLAGKLLTPAQIAALSRMPGRRDLLAAFVGTLAAPAQEFVGTLDAVAGQFVRVLAAVERKQAEPSKA